MSLKNNINKGIINWSNTKFSKVTSDELYDWEQGDFLLRSWEWVKGLNCVSVNVLMLQLNEFC